jgi:L,D-transpeptidase YcbB
LLYNLLKGAILMNKLLLKLSVAAIATAVAASAVQAETPYRKKGFFESLFGSSTPRQKRSKRQLFPWENRKGDDVNIIYGSDGNSQQYAPGNRSDISFDDPEPIPGLGMGNPAYVAPKQLLLADPSFAKLTAADEQSQAILAELSNLKTQIRAPQDERQPILEFYKKSGFKPLWIKAGAPSERAKALLAFASKTSEDGLDPLAYLPLGLSSFDNIAQQVGTDPQKLAQFDIAMTASALKLARQISGGQFDPNRLSLYNDIKPDRVDASVAMNVLAWSPFPDAYLGNLEPKNPAYAIMKAELAKLRASKAGTIATKVAEGKPVKLGRTDARIIAVRTRLNELNFGDGSASTEDDMLDSDLAENLKKFQASAKIKQTGILDAATVKSLNRDDTAANIHRLVDNLERVRWLPKSMGTRYVFVNQAAFEVRVMDSGKQVWRSSVIVGKPLTQTAAFHDEMETVVFNPSWGVPQSIIVNEYLKKLRNDPSYLDREGFKVINQQGKVVSSSSVDWGAYNNNSPLGVQQPPGSDNALGELKFLFPNKHDIYMHDTPTKNLFTQSVRAFSHGCVRVQNPREFAAVVLGWDRAKVDAETDGGISQSIPLSHKIPVHITYFTAWPDSAGKVNYYNDIYGRDEAMEKAMASNAAVRDIILSQKLVQK